MAKQCTYGCNCDNGQKTLTKCTKNRGYVTENDIPGLANHEYTRLIPLLIRTHSGRVITTAQDAERLVELLDKDWWVRDVSIAGAMVDGFSVVHHDGFFAP
jgi:hypothetical protein